MASYPVISSDDHVYEPADLWTSRLDNKFCDRAPHVIHRDEDDTDWWVCDGLVGLSGGAGAQLGRRFESPEKLSVADEANNLRVCPAHVEPPRICPRDGTRPAPNVCLLQLCSRCRYGAKLGPLYQRRHYRAN